MKNGRPTAKEFEVRKLLDQIWHEYHTSLLNFIRRRVDVADLAEDILQDVFIKAHSRLDTLAHTDSPNPRVRDSGCQFG
jgi:DNA-directed RNA polymerase specialized sigma24 family protein